MPLSSPSIPNRSSVIARVGLSTIAALILTVCVALPAHAQAPGSSRSAQAGDTSWFEKYHSAPRDTLSPAAYTGWKLFELNCSRCHGDDAQGTSFAPSLVKALGPGGPVPTEQAFLTIACNGIPSGGMPSWCSLGLGKDQLQTIYAYLKGRADGTIHPGRPTVRQASTSSGQ
jgi:mono/diheme cytochrome c family protein